MFFFVLFVEEMSDWQTFFFFGEIVRFEAIFYHDLHSKIFEPISQLPVIRFGLIAGGVSVTTYFRSYFLAANVGITIKYTYPSQCISKKIRKYPRINNWMKSNAMIFASICRNWNTSNELWKPTIANHILDFWELTLTSDEHQRENLYWSYLSISIYVHEHA